jgi:hypothetical protein
MFGRQVGFTGAFGAIEVWCAVPESANLLCSQFGVTVTIQRGVALLEGLARRKFCTFSHFIHIILSPFGHETGTKVVRAAMAHQLSMPLICTLLPILYFLARSVPSAGVHKKVIGWNTAENHAEISVTLFLFDVSNTPRHPGVVTSLS